MTEIEFDILYYIYKKTIEEKKEITKNDIIIAFSTKKSIPHLYNTLRKLEYLGIIASYRLEGYNKKYKFIKLTDKGLNYIKERLNNNGN